MTRVTMLSLHTSPLDTLGVGDGGGMNVYVREVSEQLAANGDEVDIYTLGASSQNNVVEIHPRLRVHNVGRTDSLNANPATVAKQFAEAVKEKIQRRGGTDVIHAHYWLSGLAGHILKHELGVPLVANFHTLDLVKREAGIVNSSPLRFEAEQKVIGCADAIVVSSKIEADELIALYNAEPTRIHVAIPGVDHELFMPGNKRIARQNLGLDLQRPIFLYAGRIQEIKGLTQAIHALTYIRKSQPNALLLVVGGPSGADGEHELAEAQQLVRDYELGNNVSFVGAQLHEIMPLYYRAADVCLVPSKSESFGFVALEAAACATPVVAFAVGGLQFVINNEVTGFLIENGDVQSFAESVELIIDSPLRAKMMSKEAVSWAANFTWSTTAEQISYVYDDLVADDASDKIVCLTA